LKNLIVDVPGLFVGHAHHDAVLSGVSVVLFEQPVVASCAILGGAAANRDTACLEPGMTVGSIDAVVLSGGSGFGLDAASGVQAWLKEQGRGLPVGDARIPIVPQAICFDLLNGGDKEWGRYPPYRELAYTAAQTASASPFALGTVGGGYGLATVDFKAGLGSTSARTPSGFVVGALVLVNALASAVMGEGPHFWAAPWEEGGEFGGLGLPRAISAGMRWPVWKGGREPSTTIALVATDAQLTKAQANRLAIAAHDGLARALSVSHAPLDGDTVFAAATGARPLGDQSNDLTEICIAGAACLARAIARAVYEATIPPGWAGPPCYRDRFPRR